MNIHTLADRLWFVPLLEITNRINPNWGWSLFDVLEAFNEYLLEHNVPENESKDNLLEIFDCFIIEVTEEIELGKEILKAAADSEE